MTRRVLDRLGAEHGTAETLVADMLRRHDIPFVAVDGAVLGAYSILAACAFVKAGTTVTVSPAPTGFGN